MPAHRRATLAGLTVGDGLPVAVLGALNVSPESFYGGSVARGEEDLVRAALAMQEAGAALIDVGARSTAPYLPTAISEREEEARLARAVEVLAAKLAVPISADTARPGPARAALDAGARVLNDVTGLRDPRVAALVADRCAGLILAATPERDGLGGPSETRSFWGLTRAGAETESAAQGSQRGRGGPPGPVHDPIAVVGELLREALERARQAGIAEERIVVDPGIGFFREEAMPWDEWDVGVLRGLPRLASLGRPLCVGVSRKSFLGAITGRPPEGRLAASLAATTVAVLGGAALIRTHDAAESLDAVRVTERLRGASSS
ncbi:MAG: dihydropteroate synthase [Candidatus Rokubacteria bacterium]|nr:dihydropteroate synthase [Candidatus Rokubacteria bacterium]